LIAAFRGSHWKPMLMDFLKDAFVIATNRNYALQAGAST
jgi:hypothetical protein